LRLLGWRKPRVSLGYRVTMMGSGCPRLSSTGITRLRGLRRSVIRGGPCVVLRGWCVEFVRRLAVVRERRLDHS